MLSQQTITNLTDAFQRAAVATLVRNTSDSCNIVPAGGPALGSDRATKLLMITISSFSFRLLTSFQISQDQSTRDYYTAGTHSALDEVFAEIANMCCGALGRELSAHFKHLAMSVPYGLESQCLEFLSVLEPRFQASYDITINAAAQIRATICMYCNRPVDFIPAVVMEVKHTGGELELF
jgi:hypothetical protein